MAVSMALLGALLFLGQRQMMLSRYERDVAQTQEGLTSKGQAYTSFLSRIAPQGILAHDYLLLEGYVEELSADPDVAYALIRGTSDAPLTHVMRSRDAEGTLLPPQEFQAALDEARRSPGLRVLTRPIEQGGAALGTVEVGLSQDRIARSLAELKSELRRELARVALVSGAAVLLSVVVLILLIGWVFNQMVVKPIRRLGGVMAQAPQGSFSTRAEHFRDDEIGWLAECFNRMAASLQEQWTALEDQRRAYKETRDYLANILDNSADMIVTTTLAGDVVEFNSGAERILGHRRADVVHRPVDALYADMRERERLYSRVRQGHLVQGTETRLVRADGGLIDAQLTLSPLRDNDGRLVGTVCIGRDVTQAKAMREELIQAEKMASVGQVASWIAHQIRNYLGRMSLGVAALSLEGSDRGAAEKAHRDLGDAVQDINRLVTDLLDYSRTLKLHKVKVRLNGSLEGLLSPIETEVHGRIKVERDFDSQLPPLEVDVFKLEQALTNVIKNAVDAMPDGGTLSVTTRADSDGEWVTIAIQDSGAGIPSEDLPRVLRPFFTTKSTGTGLGLAMAARIAAAHGGSLEVESPPGGGARFSFRIPAGSVEAEAP